MRRIIDSGQLLGLESRVFDGERDCKPIQETSRSNYVLRDTISRYAKGSEAGKRRSIHLLVLPTGVTNEVSRVGSRDLHRLPYEHGS